MKTVISVISVILIISITALPSFANSRILSTWTELGWSPVDKHSSAGIGVRYDCLGLIVSGGGDTREGYNSGWNVDFSTFLPAITNKYISVLPYGQVGTKIAYNEQQDKTNGFLSYGAGVQITDGRYTINTGWNNYRGIVFGFGLTF